MNKAEALAFQYAENRTQLAQVNAELKALYDAVYEGPKRVVGDGEDLRERMSELRKHFFLSDENEYGEAPEWPGWVEAAEICEEEGDVLKCAKLRDRKKKINAEGGHLRRRFAAQGRGIGRRIRRTIEHINKARRLNSLPLMSLADYIRETEGFS